jgi:hypothetical protein
MLMRQAKRVQQGKIIKASKVSPAGISSIGLGQELSPQTNYHLHTCNKEWKEWQGHSRNLRQGLSGCELTIGLPDPWGQI